MQTAPTDPNSAANLQIARDLAAAGATREELVRRSNETASYSQAKNFAANKRQGDLAEILGRTVDGGGSAEDRSLLDIAGGTVDVKSGQKRAQAYAVEAGFKIDDQNIAANRSLISRNMTQAQQRGEDTRAILAKSLRSTDFYEAAAARDLLFAQGTSGVETFHQLFSEMERDGHFYSYELGADGKPVIDPVTKKKKLVSKTRDGVDMLGLRTALQRTTISEHGKAAKEKAKDIVNAFTTNVELDDTANDPKIWESQNNTELAASSTPFMVRGAINGGITPKRASEILQDDTLRKQYNPEQREILEILAMGTPEQGRAAVAAIWDKDTGKRKDNPTRKVIDPDDPTDTIGLSNIRAPHYDVPAPGSVTSAFADYIDSSKGISTMDYDTFVQFQKNVANTPIKDGDEDMLKIRSQLKQDVTRRNNDAQIANEKAGEVIFPIIPDLLKGSSSSRSSSLAPPKSATVSPAFEAPEPASTSTPGSTSGYRRGVPVEEFNLRFQQTVNDYGMTSDQMGISREEMNSMSQDTRDKINEVMRVYRAARQVPQGQGVPPQRIREVQEDLRNDMIRDIRRVIDGGPVQDYWA